MGWGQDLELRTSQAWRAALLNTSALSRDVKGGKPRNKGEPEVGGTLETNCSQALNYAHP